MLKNWSINRDTCTAHVSLEHWSLSFYNWNEYGIILGTYELTPYRRKIGMKYVISVFREEKINKKILKWTRTMFLHSRLKYICSFYKRKYFFICKLEYNFSVKIHVNIFCLINVISYIISVYFGSNYLSRLTINNK